MSDKRKEKGAQRRKIIIDAAISCIATRGLCDTTLDRVAEIAEVSRTLVVFHFKTKKEMFAVVLEEIAAKYNTEWEIILKDEKAKPAEDKLIQLISYDLQLPLKKPELISVWHTFWGEAKGLYKEFNAARDKKYSNDLNELIRQIIEIGNYKDIDTKHIASGLEAMLLGFWWTAHVNPKDYKYKTNMRIVKSYLKLNFPNHF